MYSRLRIVLTGLLMYLGLLGHIRPHFLQRHIGLYPPTTPPTSPSPTPPVPITHVTSKKLSRYLNWKKTAQRKETRCPGQPSEPFSAVWTARRLYQDKPESALAALSIWTHQKRSKEVSHETIAELNALSDENVILALNELKELKKYI
jgi:hypothetical protein